MIEDTIRRNASPVRDASTSLGALAGSSSSINSSASDDSAPPVVHRANLFHSLSTNDATVGEYKYTVNVRGQYTIKITGNNLELVKTSKIVLDDYFNKYENKEINGFDEFLPVESFTNLPISPIEKLAGDDSNQFSNGQSDDNSTPIVIDGNKMFYVHIIYILIVVIYR